MPLHLFNKDDIIKSNRSGAKAIILEVILQNQEYLYKYINPTSKNFEGVLCHSFDAIEDHWHLFENSNKENECNHDYEIYVGLQKVEHTCKKCNHVKKNYGM